MTSASALTTAPESAAALPVGAAPVRMPNTRHTEWFEVHSDDVVNVTRTLLPAPAEVWVSGVLYRLLEQQVAGIGRCLVLWPKAIPDFTGTIVAASFDDRGDRWVGYTDACASETRAVYRHLREHHGFTYLGRRSAVGGGGRDGRRPGAWDGRPVWERRAVVAPAARDAASKAGARDAASSTEPVAATPSSTKPTDDVSFPVPGMSRLGAALAQTRHRAGAALGVTVTPRTIPWKVTSCDRHGKPTERWWCPPDLVGVVLIDSAVEASSEPRGRYKVGYFDLTTYRSRGDVVVQRFSFGSNSARDALAFIAELRAMNTGGSR